MRLTTHTDYALRVLLALAMQPNQNVPVATLAQQFRVSLTHLQKVVQHLGQAGWVSSARGRGGGVRLAKPATEVHIGEVIRSIEPQSGLVECLSGEHSECPLINGCGLQRALVSAELAFFQSLNRHTLASLARRSQLDALLGAERPTPTADA
jgi:Rrf2 family nitric oxide-sensitive transcriptional repressor